MNNKHFIWIVPLLFSIGFFIGYLSGLTIPKDITFTVDKYTLDTMDKITERAINETAPVGEYITTDGNHMVRIEYLMKMPMTKADYLRMYKRQIISKTDYETCLRRLK